MFKIILALPCYNEAPNITDLLLSIDLFNKSNQEQIHVTPLVIDDCSTDNTKALLEELKERFTFDVIHHPVNKGLTGGINTAINYFYQNSKSEHPANAYALMDGDNSHHPEAIALMVPKVKSGRDVVIASRFQKGSKIHGVSEYRQVLSFGLTIIFKILRNIPRVRDYSCGFRLYSPAIIKKLIEHYGNEVVTEKSFASMVELLVKCHLLKADCDEVPFTLRYDKKLGASKMDVKATIKGNLKLLRALKEPK